MCHASYIRPFARFGFFPVGGRSTAIRLRDGGVWVLASTPLDTETKAKLDELGQVKLAILSAEPRNTSTHWTSTNLQVYCEPRFVPSWHSLHCFSSEIKQILSIISICPSLRKLIRKPNCSVSKRCYRDQRTRRLSLMVVSVLSSTTFNLNFNHRVVWGKDPPNAKYGFEDDVCLFDFRNRSVGIWLKCTGPVLV
jgi:hypothetical protein